MSDLVPMLRLDLHSLVAARRTLGMFVLMAALFAFAGGATFAVPLIAMTGMMVGLTLFGTAETNKLTLLYGSLPLRRRTVVVSHYLVTAGATTLAVAAGMAVAALASVARGESTAGLVLGGVGVLGILLVVLSVLVPLQMAWGAVVGSFAAMALALGVAGVAVFGLGADGVRDATASVESAGAWVVWVLLGAGLVALAVSALVAVRIYERQDH